MADLDAAVHGAPSLPLVAAVAAIGFVILRHRQEIVAWTTRALADRPLARPDWCRLARRWRLWRDAVVLREPLTAGRHNRPSRKALALGAALSR